MRTTLSPATKASRDQMLTANQLIIRGRISRIKIRNRRKKNARVKLAVDDHLRLQTEIERSAYELWHAGGCRQTASLNDWLQAERQTSEEFIRTRFGQHPLQRETGNLPAPGEELNLGRHQYLFLIDGKPRPDAQAMGAVRNAQNKLVSLIAVS